MNYGALYLKINDLLTLRPHLQVTLPKSSTRMYLNRYALKLNLNGRLCLPIFNIFDFSHDSQWASNIKNNYSNCWCKWVRHIKVNLWNYWRVNSIFSCPPHSCQLNEILYIPGTFRLWNRHQAANSTYFLPCINMELTRQE